MELIRNFQTVSELQFCELRLWCILGRSRKQFPDERAWHLDKGRVLPKGAPSPLAGILPSLEASRSRSGRREEEDDDDIPLAATPTDEVPPPVHLEALG